MKASDFIVQYLINYGITDVFGYPGGMVTHLIDSLRKYKKQINTHINYNEQGSALAACGYAQYKNDIGVAFATSGPGATNLITGICNAYMDSIPVVFITGQVNSYEQKGTYRVRQRGFQETDIVSMVGGVTKYSVRINDVKQLEEELNKSFGIANAGRKGPVLLDIAMDVMRNEVEPTGDLDSVAQSVKKELGIDKEYLVKINQLVQNAKKPVILFGNGFERENKKARILLKRLDNINVPIVSSLLAVDISRFCNNYFGFIGTYGSRIANFIIAKSDLVISIGSRLDIRQVGINRDKFAPKAKLIRIDIDKGELEYKVHRDELSLSVDSIIALNEIINSFEMKRSAYSEWNDECKYIREKLNGIDEKEYNRIISEISRLVPDDTSITTDVGQNQLWVAQSFKLKKKQRIFFSGGHGAMGYSLPAAVGVCVASNKRVYSFNGDGGIQMNIQELEFISKEELPVKIFVFNNGALGMIRHFQEMYFDKDYYMTTNRDGFSSPDFRGIAKAYKIGYKTIENVEDIEKVKNLIKNKKPALIEIKLSGETYAYPKLEFGKPNQDQEPLLDRDLFNELMKEDYSK